jgi:poly(hydroxyalkanoate) granule-associated protein
MPRPGRRGRTAGIGGRVRQLASRTGVDTAELLERAQGLRRQFDRETRRARKQVAARLVALQQRARRDARTLGRSADAAVARALAALNIPSRHEVQQLSRRVEELRQRVERLRR